jgi:phosphatidylinositol alpha-1,6-mannosyltransferase
MKICFLVHNLRHDNGGGVLARHLVEGARKSLNCDVVALTALSSADVYAQPLLYPNKFKLLKNFFKIRRILKKADIIHALDVFPYGIIATFFSIGLRKKIVITIVGSGSIIPLYNRFLLFLSRYCYQRADYLTAISHFTKNEVLKKIKGLSIEVINPGVDFDKFSAPSSRSFKEKLNLPNSYILSVGSLRWRKGYKFSIPAFAKTSVLFPDLHYVIVGKKYAEKQYNLIQQLISDLKLEEKIFILDNIDSFEELRYIYKNAKLFVLMSQNVDHDIEGFGMVFLEAAALGLPVVGSKACGVEDAVQEGKNGFLVDSRDIDDCAQAMVKILSDIELRNSMSKESIFFAKAQSWGSKIEQYKKIYQKLLKASAYYNS